MALTYRNRDVFKTLSEAGINYIRLRHGIIQIGNEINTGIKRIIKALDV